jgi:hypothetical protein
VIDHQIGEIGHYNSGAKEEKRPRKMIGKKDYVWYSWL